MNSTNKTANMIHEIQADRSRSYFMLESCFLQKVKTVFCNMEFGEHHTDILK